MAIATAQTSDATPLDEPTHETSEMSEVQETRDQATPAGQKVDTRVRGKCNTRKRDCKNPPLPGEFYCAWDLHNPHMKPHAEQKISEVRRKLEFLEVGIGDDFAPATNLMRKAETAFDAEEFSRAYHLAVQAFGKGLELNGKPRVERAIALRDEFGFLDQRASDLATQAESEAKKPRPNWPQASIWAAGAINALQPYHERAERNRQERQRQAEETRNLQARAKAERDAREAAEKAEREQRAERILAGIGTAPVNTGTMPDEERRKAEEMRRTLPPGAGKNQKKEPKPKNGKNKKSSKGKK
ncbi:MAG TPA: hypothetical protein VFK94_06025 [Patescibacteria group bacterium]|nr:hypothetical protein [Patescibacteria group bacterium]